jgi:hypothetical protein
VQPPTNTLNLEHLFQLRLAIARLGEMDNAGWWNTNGTTLWQLPAAIEDQFEDQWQTWLDDTDRWQPFFAKVAAVQSRDVLGTLRDLDLITDDEVIATRRLNHAVEGYTVALPGGTLDDATIRLLAAGFAHGELTEPLQLAMDNGARRALIPLTNKRNFLEVSADILEHVDPIFYGDPRMAASKALGIL